MQEIKNAVDELFKVQPYHEITLTTIANKLNWTRVNLYKYISTKEEIFLEICADYRDAYYEALKAAFPANCGYSIDVFAEIWAGILNAHQEFLHYCDILSTIIETNVSIERLGKFKKNYYIKTYEIVDLISKHFDINRDKTYDMFLNIHFHSVGIYSICRFNPLVTKALENENLTAPSINFRENMKEFIRMNLKFLCNK